MIKIRGTFTFYPDGSSSLVGYGFVAPYKGNALDEALEDMVNYFAENRTVSIGGGLRLESKTKPPKAKNVKKKGMCRK